MGNILDPNPETAGVVLVLSARKRDSAAPDLELSKYAILVVSARKYN